MEGERGPASKSDKYQAVTTSKEHGRRPWVELRGGSDTKAEERMYSIGGKYGREPLCGVGSNPTHPFRPGLPIIF